MSSQFDENTRKTSKTISNLQLQCTRIKIRTRVDIRDSLSGHQKLYLKFSNKIHNKFAPVFYNPWIRSQCRPWLSALNIKLFLVARAATNDKSALCKFVGTIIPLLFSRCWLHAALFCVWNCYNELCYWECQIIIASAKPSDYFDCNCPMGNPTVVNPIEWLYFTVIMDFPHGLHRLLVINVNIPCSRANIWIVCAMNVSLVDWLKHYITKPAAYLSVDSSSYKMTNMIEYGWTKSRFHLLCLHTHLVKLILSKADFLMMWTMWFLEHNV